MHGDTDNTEEYVIHENGLSVTGTLFSVLAVWLLIYKNMHVLDQAFGTKKR